MLGSCARPVGLSAGSIRNRKSSHLAATDSAPETLIGTIFVSAGSFMFLKAAGPAIRTLFPEIIPWLPRLVYG